MVATALLGFCFFKDQLSGKGWLAAMGALVAAILLAWSFSGTDVVIVVITGGLFKFFCAQQPRTAGGNWDLQDNTLRLADGTGNLTLFAIDATAVSLTNDIGEQLPGLQAEVYTKP